MKKMMRSACTRHCGDGCGLLVESGGDGKLSIRGNPDHPFTQGFICAKTARFAERLASPRRITAPLVRDGDGFREASWEEALGLAATQIQQLRATPERLLHIHYHASFGLLHKASKLLFATLGASGFSGSPCLGAGAEALKRDFGAVRQGPLGEAVSAARIVNWGRNTSAQSVHLSAMLAQARKRGARVLAVHPGDQGYSGLADEQIVIRPGTDRFLAAAALKILMGRDVPGKEGHDGSDQAGPVAGGTERPDAVSDRACGLSAGALARCAGSREFLELLAGLDLGELLDACGVRREQAERLADWYSPDSDIGESAGEDATATLIGRGVQRYAFGGENVRFIDALAVLSGNVGRKGGGVFFKRQDLGQMAADWASPKPGYSRTFPIADLARSVEAADPPVEFIWVEGLNLVTQCPDSLALAEMLKERFTVVVEPFLTDTARCAQVILPPALMLECEDIAVNDAHQCVNHSAKVLTPRGLCRSNFDIAAALGARLDPPVAYPDPEEVLDSALRRGKVQASLAELRDKGWLGVDMPETPWADGVFAHPDGLYRLPEALHPDRPEDAEYPLRLLSPVRKDSLLSQVPEDEQESPPRVFVSPDSAALAGLLRSPRDGQPVNRQDGKQPHPGSRGGCLPNQAEEAMISARLETALGSMEVRVGVLDGLHPDAVLYPRGDWLSRGGCVNRLIRPREADMGGQTAYYEERARLVMAPPSQE